MNRYGEKHLPPVATFLVLAAAGLVQTWASRNIMNPDGIQYIEIGQNYVRGYFSRALNGYWSPLYSWVLGLVLGAHLPSPARELTLVHLTNFGLYLFALVGFSFFLKELIRYQLGLVSSDSDAHVPMWVWQVFGYALFFSASLDLITINDVTPDMAVSAFVYFIAGLLMRIRRGQTQWTSFATLGLLLGLGYLAKSVMFIFALIVILAAFQLTRSQRLSSGRLAPTILIFLVVAAPFITALSLQKRRFTIGDTGRVAFISNVNSLPRGYVHGVPPNANLVFKHPPRQIYPKPAVYEFSAVRAGSCPVWYDASYWYDGARFFFVPKNEIRELFKNVYRSADILLLHQGSVLVGIFLFWVYAMPVRRSLSEVWYLLVPATTVLALYFLSLVQARYVAPFLVMVWGALFFGFRMEASSNAGLMKRSVLLATATVLLATVGVRVARDTLKGAPDRRDPDNLYWALKDEQVAAELNKAGIQEGDTVALIGNSIWAYWAHLARIRITAEIPDEDVDSYYQASLTVRESVMRSLASTGVKAVVADRFPPELEGQQWRPLGSTGYYLHQFP